MGSVTSKGKGNVHRKAQLDLSKEVGVKMVAIDWSGVVSDDRRPVYEANMRMMEARGMERFTFEQWLPRTQLSPVEFFEKVGIHEDPSKIMKEYAELYSAVRGEGENPFAYPDAKKALRALAKMVPIVVISSHPKEHLIKEASEYGLRSCFTDLFGSVRDKSDGIAQVCALNKVEPAKVAYAGDTIFDVEAAKKAGAIPFAVATGYHVRERLEASEPFLVVGSLTEFKDAVSGLVRR